ncbi:MAG: isopenicillin N synthase family oxygenase [Gammaproteobacteria bacterium]|nr:isopenicillin N synthase family oxygenase [Gammaproteobacteria bacterium]
MVDSSRHDKRHGPRASSAQFARYDQVPKPDYHLAEAADGPESFEENFSIASCDIGRCLHGNARDRDAFAQELGEAMRNIGFVILEGHGVDARCFQEAAGWVEELFTITSLEQKLDFRAARHGAVSEGYFPIKETSDIHPDLVEGWVFGRRAFNLDGDPAFDARTCWPRPEFEPQFRRLILAELPLFLPIMQSILRFLGCDPQLYDERLARPNFGQRLNYYPPVQCADAQSGAGRLLAHEDVDLFTLLPAPAVEGLQVLNTNGKWIRLHAPPGTIVLNTGDYLQRITNDLLPSTTHRVSPPRDPELAALPRVSFPLAAYLKPDEILEVLPGLPNPKYEPIRVITFHTRTTAKFYGDAYAVESPVE